MYCRCSVSFDVLFWVSAQYNIVGDDIHPAAPVAMYLFGLNFQIELQIAIEYMLWLNE